MRFTWIGWICALCIQLGSVVPRASGQQSGQAAVKITSPTQPALTAHASELITAGKFKDALMELDALTARQPGTHAPTTAGIERLRGLAYYQLADFNKSETALTKALKQNPEDRESRQLLGVTLYRLGRPAEAIPILEAEHSLTKGATAEAAADPSYLLSLCYIDVQRYDDARRTIAAEYGFAAESPSAYLLAGRFLLRREAVVPAEASAKQALALNPSVPLAHELLGDIDLAKSDIAHATAEFRTEQEVNPLYGGVYERLGDAYFRGGDYESARKSLDQALLLEPNVTGPYILLGKVLLKQQNPMMATGYLQRALKMDPANYIAHLLLGQAYHATGRLAESSREFQAAEQMRFTAPPDSSPSRPLQ